MTTEPFSNRRVICEVCERRGHDGFMGWIVVGDGDWAWTTARRGTKNHPIKTGKRTGPGFVVRPVDLPYKPKCARGHKLEVITAETMEARLIVAARRADGFLRLRG